MRDVNVIGIIIVCVIAIIILLSKHLRLKKQIRKLSVQIKELTDGANEKMLDIALIDRDLESLAGEMNRYSAAQRYTVAGALQHEEHLKESVANISHDLRTPLTVMIGHLQLLQKAGLAEPERERVAAVLQKASQMKDLIGEFYDLSIIDSHQNTIRKERINLSNLLTDFLAESGPLLEGRGILPDISIPDSTVFVNGDRSMLERILQNLLANAVRYTDGAVKICLYEQGTAGVVLKIENRVRDAGQLDPARMFERFYTGDRSRHGGGTGLGLAVVKLLAEKMGGEVSAQLNGDWLSVKVTLLKI